MNGPTRAVVAELVGTFCLCFVAAGAVVADRRYGGLGPLGTAAAYGLAGAVAVSATGHISGGHLNPAVTFAMLLARRIGARDALGYAFAQLLGAAIGGHLLTFVYPEAAWKSASLGTPLVKEGYSFAAAVVVEAVLTSLVLFAFFGTTVDPRGPKIGGLGVGLALAFGVLACGPLTGAAMNPARAFGPALAGGYWNGHLVYWLGPLLGGGAAALVYGKVLLERDT